MLKLMPFTTALSIAEATKKLAELNAAYETVRKLSGYLDNKNAALQAIQQIQAFHIEEINRFTKGIE